MKSGRNGAGTELLLTTRAPTDKGTPTGQIPKNSLGLVIITINLETHTSFLGERRKKIQEISPAVISVHLKFPHQTELGPGLPLSPPHNLPGLHPWLKWCLCVGRQRQHFLLRKKCPHLLPSLTLHIHGSLATVVLVSQHCPLPQLLKESCKKEVTCHHIY